jgi:hypothetical protein
VVQLDDERDLVGVAPGHDPEHAERRGDRVAAALHRQLTDVGRIEVLGVRGEGRRGRVFDALVHGEDGHVPGPAQTAVVEQRLQVAQHLRGPVALLEDPSDVVGAGQVQVISGDALGLVAQEGVGFVAQQAREIGHVITPLGVRTPPG